MPGYVSNTSSCLFVHVSSCHLRQAWLLHQASKLSIIIKRASYQARANPDELIVPAVGRRRSRPAGEHAVS